MSGITNIDSNDTNNTTNSIPESVYGGMNGVFEQTRAIIAEMQQGQRIGVKDLADKVHAKIDTMSNANVLNLVQMFCKQSKDVTVEVGRMGGIYKGGKIPRIDKRERCVTCNQVIRPNMKQMTHSQSQDELEQHLTDV